MKEGGGVDVLIGDRKPRVYKRRLNSIKIIQSSKNSKISAAKADGIKNRNYLALTIPVGNYTMQILDR